MEDKYLFLRRVAQKCLAHVTSDDARRELHRLISHCDRKIDQCSFVGRMNDERQELAAARAGNDRSAAACRETQIGPFTAARRGQRRRTDCLETLSRTQIGPFLILGGKDASRETGGVGGEDRGVAKSRRRWRTSTGPARC